jgi:glycosyltransferase involved in cell wall biosynthesis
LTTKISVLISLYKSNNPIFFEQALDSCFKQTYPPSEVVLVIDGEITSELQYVVAKFSSQYGDSFKIVPLKKNIGQGPALNEGLKHCSNELVARMDTDDISKLTRFEKQVMVFEKNPYIDILSSWVDEFKNSPDEILFTRKLPEKHSEIVKYSKKRCPLNHPAIMYKKSKIIDCGGYELLGFMDDYVLWMKLIKNGAIFYNIQESLLFYRMGDDMYERRGGFKYAIDECRLQWLFYKRNMVSLPIVIKNIIARSFVRILPNKIRAFIYQNYLR